VAVLVTGGLGYVGSHAVKLLVEQGREVVNLDDLSFGHVEAACGSKVVVGDIGDPDLLRGLFTEHRIDAVMHFAASADVGESVTNPQKYYDNNLSKSLALLREMLAAGVVHGGGLWGARGRSHPGRASEEPDQPLRPVEVDAGGDTPRV
jgi:UDP-glucose 4-epimerase